MFSVFFALNGKLKSRIALHRLATFNNATTVNVDTTAYSAFVVMWEIDGSYSANATITIKNLSTKVNDFRFSGTSTALEGFSQADVTIRDNEIECSHFTYVGNYIGIGAGVSVYGLGLTS